MKKLLISILLMATICTGGISANASVKSDTNVDAKNQILSMMPEVTLDELDASIKDAAQSLNKSEEEITSQILQELETQQELTDKDTALQNTRGGSSVPTYTLGAAKYNGDIFYEPASTFSVQHGHVGIYWTANTVVESMPGTGVRSINRANKKVEKGSRIFTLSGVSVNTQNIASNWAYSRIGDSYSYNFATNRSTTRYGAKNCSKLVWSAYMEKANLDLDADGGLGVYPKDILRHSKASVYTSY